MLPPRTGKVCCKTARNILEADSKFHRPKDPENLGRLVKMLCQLEQKSSAPATNEPRESEANSSNK